MVSLWQIFLVFAKIGAFTIGGGYAIMAIIEKEVTKRGWLSKEDFPDIMALAQSAPGILAVNISIFAGYKIKGTKGSIVATLGSVTPSFLIILAIAMLFTGYQDNPIVISIFKGIRPVVVALIAGPMVQMAKRSNKKWWTWILTVAALAMVAFLEFSPIYILLTTIVVFGIIAWTRDNKKTSR
jgi:chromate transporter